MPPAESRLEQLDPDKIGPNPDNPRLIFHEDELLELEESISEVGIQVPLSVYPERRRFVLLDGERRLRCARKLNLKVVPAIIIPKPPRLENILRMFNIHNVRKAWDLMPMAIKLGEVKRLLQKEGKDASPKALAAVTGVSLSTVIRALDLMSLPAKYRRMLMNEAEKPRSQQRIKPDLFIEVYKSLHAIKRHVPEALNQFTETEYVTAMVEKYMAGTVDNVVAFRDVSRMARSEGTGGSRAEVLPAIGRLVSDADYTIQGAYSDTVESVYQTRDLITKIESLTRSLSDIRRNHRLSPEVLESLTRLRAKIDSVVN